MNGLRFLPIRLGGILPRCRGLATSIKADFASDNAATIHPRILQALHDANKDAALGYGNDVETEQAVETMRKLLGKPKAEVFFVYGGTGGNIVALQCVMRSIDAVVCADLAHLAVDECGAPEKFIGCKVVGVPTDTSGKLTVDAVQPFLKGFGVCHHNQPRVLSITQATEYGTVYTREEFRALTDLARSHNMLVHVDGARIANAAVTRGCSFEELLEGVDVMTFGGTKNGLMLGEAVVGLNPDLNISAVAPFVRKQSMQLASKHRYIARQFHELLKDGLWKECATQANTMARRLKEGLQRIPGVEITRPVEANAVFAKIPRPVQNKLREEYVVLDWTPRQDEVRLMCAFDTTEKTVDDLVKAVERLSL